MTQAPLTPCAAMSCDDKRQGKRHGKRKRQRQGIKTDSLVSGLSLLLAFSIGQRLIGFARNLLFCRWLEPTELGRWNLVFNLLILGAPLVVLGIPGSFGRYIEHYRQNGQLRCFLGRTTALSALLAVVGILSLSLSPRYAAWLFLGDAQLSNLLLIAMACLTTVVLFNFLVELFTSLRQLKIVSFMQIANSLLFAAFSLGLLLYWRRSAVSIVVGYGLACLITALASTPAIIRNWQGIQDEGPAPTHSSLWTRLLPFAWYIWLTDVVLNLFAAADRYMIVHFANMASEASAAMIGQYHSSLIIPSLLLSIACMIASVIMPYLSDDWEKGNRDSVTQNVNGALQAYGLLAFCASIAVLFFSPILFHWALQGRYTDGLSLLPWTLALSVWAGSLTISFNFLRCAERAGTGTFGPVVGLVINVGLNLLLLPRLGLLGAVLATAAANLITYFLGLYFCHRSGFKTEPGTLWIAALPLTLPMGLPIALTAACITLWASVRTQWICSRKNQITILNGLQSRLPDPLANRIAGPLRNLVTTP